MALLIEIKAADGMVSRTRLETGRNRFSVRLGDSYRIIDDQTGLTPNGVAVKRVDNNLIVDGLDTAGTSVEFAEFYNICSVGSPCQLNVESGPGSTPVAITPGTQPIGALADGSFVLYDPNFADTAPPAPSLGDGTMVRNILYGVGGLAVVGLAAGGGGGGGGGGNNGGRPPDGSLKLTSSEFTNSRTPTISGQGEPGSRVIVRIDTDGDGTPNVTYGTTVGTDFTWSVNLATAVPESGALPATGLSDASNVGISSSTSSGLASLPTFVLKYDGVPPAPAVVDTIAGDNVVNAGEKQAGFVISGSAEPNSSVVLTIGTQVVATVVAGADGRWQTAPVVGAAVPADGSHQLSVTVIDQAGNQSAATTRSFGVDTTPPSLQQLSVAGGDGQVRISDAGNVAFAGTTEPGTSVRVDWNGIVKPVTAAGNGSWSVAFTGAEVPAPTETAGRDIAYTITATDVAGNVFAQPGSVLVDVVAPGTPSINVVAGDDLVTQGERVGGIPVTGSAEAGSSVNVTWGSTTRTVTANGGGQWQADFASSDIPGVASPSGTTTISASASDAVGNNSAASQRSVTVEAPYPAPLINAVAGDDVVNAAERAGNVTLSGTVAAGVAGINIAWGTSYAAAAVISNGTWSAVVPAGQVPADGPTTVVVVTTGAGGGAFATRPVLVDTTPPKTPTDELVWVAGEDDSISFLELSNFTVQGLAGSTDASASVSVQLGTAAVRTAVADGNGAWVTSSYGVADVAPGPSVPLTVTVTDTAGNSSVFTDQIAVAQLAEQASPSLASFSPATAPIVAAPAVAYAAGPSSSLDSLMIEDMHSGRLA